MATTFLNKFVINYNFVFLFSLSDQSIFHIRPPVFFLPSTVVAVTLYSSKNNYPSVPDCSIFIKNKLYVTLEYLQLPLEKASNNNEFSPLSTFYKEFVIVGSA